MGKNAKDLVLSVSLLTLYSLKWWHHLEPAAPSTSYRIWEQVKWHFFIVLKTSVFQTRLTQKMLGRGVLTWVHGEALICLIWLLMSIILSHLCYLDTFPADETARPTISQGKGFQLVPTWACFQTESKQTHCGIWKRSPVSAVSLGTSSICVSLYCLQVH